MLSSLDRRSRTDGRTDADAQRARWRRSFNSLIRRCRHDDDWQNNCPPMRTNDARACEVGNPPLEWTLSLESSTYPPRPSLWQWLTQARGQTAKSPTEENGQRKRSRSPAPPPPPPPPATYLCLVAPLIVWLIIPAGLWRSITELSLVKYQERFR